MPVPGGLLGKRQRHRHEPVLPGQPLASPIGSSTFSSCKCVHGQHVVPAVRRDPQHVPGEFHRAAGLDQQGNPWFYGPSARSIHRRRIHHRARRRTVLLGVRGDRHRRVNTWCWTGVLNQCPANTSAAGQLHLPRVGVHVRKRQLHRMPGQHLLPPRLRRADCLAVLACANSAASGICECTAGCVDPETPAGWRCDICPRQPVPMPFQLIRLKQLLRSSPLRRS